MFDYYQKALVKFRWPIIIFTIILVGILGSGARFLKFTADYRIFFNEDDIYLQTLNTLHNTYTKDDIVLFVITPKDGNVFSRENLAAVQQLTDQAWEIPHVQRVDSLKNFQHTYANGDELIVHDLYDDAESLTDQELEKIKQVALNDTLLRNRLVSANGRVTGVNLTVQLPGLDDQTEVPEVALPARKLAKAIMKSYPDLDIRLTGGLMMSNAFPEASLHDIKSLIPAMFAVVFITLAILFRSASATLCALLVILFSIIATMGTAGWLGFKLSPPSAATPNIILTVAVADCVHVLVSFLHEMRSGWISRASWKEQRIQATKASLAINTTPIFITSLTTALGFLSLNFSDSPPFHDLGNIVAIGVVYAYLFSIIFLPALMMIMPVKIRPYKTKGRQSMEIFSRFVINNRNTLLIVMTVFVFAMVSFLPKNELNDDTVKYFSADNTFRVDTEYAANRLTGIYAIEYSLPASNQGGINDPEYLATLENFSEWYRDQPETLHVNSISDILKRLNKNMHSDDAQWYKLPDSRELAAQYLLLYEMSLPEGLDLNDRINVNKSASRLTVAIKMLSSNEILDLEKRADEWLRQNAPDYMQKTRATGVNIIFSHIGKNNIAGMLKGTALALVLISVILIFALKSIPLGIISLLPNLIPATMAFGLWGLINGQINLGISVVASLTLGIVVDDTVHFLSKYSHARRNLALGNEASVNYAFSHVGTALWITSFVLVCGFSMLTLSDFELNAQLGLLTAITIVFALLADFLFLPPILLLFKRK
ncbi:MAG: MMPL family transporter [Methylococcales bacterium]